MAPTTDLDGRDRAVDWYNAYKVDEAYDGGENYGGPPYWGKYVFHDNNRDINYGVDSLRAHLEWYLHWVPPVWHDLHEAQVLLYTFSGQPPQNANLDPILYSELPFFATYEVNKLTGYGMPGRVALRLRRHVVARLPRLRRRQPQRHAADVRDLQPGRRQHQEGAAVGHPAHPRVVPAQAGAVGRGRLVDPQLDQLRADRRADRAGAGLTVPGMLVENFYRKSVERRRRPARPRRPTPSCCRPASPTRRASTAW